MSGYAESSQVGKLSSGDVKGGWKSVVLSVELAGLEAVIQAAQEAEQVKPPGVTCWKASRKAG